MDRKEMNEDLVQRLKKRAEIRRQISTRKSVQEGKPDRLSELLEEAATELEKSWEEGFRAACGVLQLPIPEGVEPMPKSDKMTPMEFHKAFSDWCLRIYSYRR